MNNVKIAVPENYVKFLQSSVLRAILKRLHSYRIRIFVFQNFPTRISLDHGNISTFWHFYTELALKEKEIKRNNKIHFHENRTANINCIQFRKNMTKKGLSNKISGFPQNSLISSNIHKFMGIKKARIILSGIKSDEFIWDDFGLIRTIPNNWE